MFICSHQPCKQEVIFSMKDTAYICAKAFTLVFVGALIGCTVSLMLFETAHIIHGILN